MMKSCFPFLCRALLLGAVLWSGTALGQIPKKRFAPERGARIVLLGNTFADRMRHYGYFEALLQQSFPDRQLSLRNMGWSADEVGLQPRPLNFPGFGEKTSPPPSTNEAVTFKGYTHEGGKIVMPVALHLAGLNQDLTEQKADIILLCFGMNEAFKGPAGLAQFDKDLDAFIRNLQSHQYNGRAAPRLVLVSPIAHEDLGGHLPDPKEHNSNLELYTQVMRNMAQAKDLLFIDLFTPSLSRMKSKGKPPITINGIHLNDAGYRLAAAWMGRALGLRRHSPGFDSQHSQKLRQVIKMKDDHFFYRWRAVNGEYIYGRRREPFGVIAFPPELRKLNQMTAALDSVIWELAASKRTGIYQKAVDIVDRRGKPVDPMLLPAVPMVGRQGEAARQAAGHVHPQQKVWPTTTGKFRLPEGYEINLFASEKDFPVEEAVAMNFDARGRLWVATMPTYPQYFPGIPVHDKIVILEDTNADGKADKHTVFADDLYLPLGFEFGNGGVYVSQEPDILFLKDTDGDDKADVREVVLTGFGSEDSHHATHAFTFGPDGALYFNEGTFLNTQVETPYGPVRSYAGATYRYEPRTGKLEHYISYPYFNPWGSVFDQWGTHLIGDASDGSNYFAPPMTGKIDYPDKHPRMEMFTETRVRPTAGIEIISSRHFPDQVQGDFLVNNNIGFQGTKQHQIMAKGSGITSKEVEPLLQSSDPNFRPIDLKFGPDGALYIVDWYNPLVSHGENPPRDPARDKSHGRIWRITYKHKPLLKVVDVSRQTLPELLDNLTAHEDRLRYRSRAQIRQQKPSEVLPQVKKWVAAQDRNNPRYEHNLLEALWLYQDFEVVEPQLLHTLLQARQEQARAAATKVLLHWRERVPNALALMRKQVNDLSPRVRLEAVVALSHFNTREAVAAVMDVFQYPTDYYLDYGIRETLKYLKPIWLADLKENEGLSAIKTPYVPYLLSLATARELLEMPQSPEVLTALLGRNEVDADRKKQALGRLAKRQNTDGVQVLLPLIRAAGKSGAVQPDLIRLLLQSDPQELRVHVPEFLQLIGEDSSRALHAPAYAAVMTAEQSDQAVWGAAQKNIPALMDYLTGVSLLADAGLKASFTKKVERLATQVPGHLVKQGPSFAQKGIRSPFYPIHALANSLILQMPGPAETKAARLKDFISGLESTPESEQGAAAFTQAIREAKGLVAQVPDKYRPQMLAALEKMGTMEIKLLALEAKMAFDKNTITVPAGKRISLVFENPDLMPHNVVIVKPGSVKKVGEAADAMASLKDGFEKNFVPAMPEVLFATPLVNSGKSFRLNFKAPEKPGDYPFICSFPGHWRVMQGLIKVTQ